MAYYDALIAEWPLLSPGTTAVKLAQINAMTVTGAVPTLFYTTGAAILNCLDYTEFAALPAAQQTTILQICAIPGPIAAGSSLPFVSKLFATFYATKLAGPTIAAMVALAKGTVTPWWQANGYTAPINGYDLIAAGGLS